MAMAGVKDVHVVESDSRKCTFMREVARHTDIKITVHNKRIEQMEPFSAAVISARALANLSELLAYAESLKNRYKKIG